MKPLTFADRIPVEQRKQLQEILNKSHKKRNNKVNSKTSKAISDAEWAFMKYFEDHIPSVPHHLIAGKQRNNIQNDRNRRRK